MRSHKKNSLAAAQQRVWRAAQVGTEQAANRLRAVPEEQKERVGGARAQQPGRKLARALCARPTQAAGGAAAAALLFERAVRGLRAGPAEHSMQFWRGKPGSISFVAKASGTIHRHPGGRRGNRPPQEKKENRREGGYVAKVAGREAARSVAKVGGKCVGWAASRRTAR